MAEIAGRRVFSAQTTPFLEYDLEGEVQPEMSWLPISYDRETGQGTTCGRSRSTALRSAGYDDSLSMHPFGRSRPSESSSRSARSIRLTLLRAVETRTGTPSTPRPV